MARRDLVEWTPGSLATAMLIDPSNKNGLSISDGDAISYWKDDSRRGQFSVSQTTAGNQPTWTESALNGNAAFTYASTGSARQLKTTQTGLVVAWYVAVFNYTGAANFASYPILAWDANGVAGTKLIMGNGASTILSDNGTFAVNGGALSATCASLSPLTSPVIVYGEPNLTYANATSTLTNGVCLGDTGSRWVGDLYYFACGQVALTTQERSLLFLYLNDRFAIY